MNELIKITREELNDVLEKHKLLLDTYGMEGESVDLSYTDLRGFNLTRVNLRYVNLEGACLAEANLSFADLYDADLYDADLKYADLTGTNLSDADLSDADLVGANLTGTDLTGANLTGTDLSGANLADANLRDANLQDANLFNVKNLNIPMACPETGSFIGWKRAGEYIVKLEIPEDAKRSSSTGIKCRCDKAKVLSIENYDRTSADVTEVCSEYDPEFIYRVGETVIVDDFDNNRFNECAPGIHFFMNRTFAVYFYY